MMKEHEYVRETLERYTNCPLEEFCDHILITKDREMQVVFKVDMTGLLSSSPQDAKIQQAGTCSRRRWCLPRRGCGCGG